MRRLGKCWIKRRGRGRAGRSEPSAAGRPWPALRRSRRAVAPTRRCKCRTKLCSIQTRRDSGQDGESWFLRTPLAAPRARFGTGCRRRNPISGRDTILYAKLRSSTILRVRTVLGPRASAARDAKNRGRRRDCDHGRSATSGCQTPFWRPVAKLCTIKPRAPARERVRPAASEFDRSCMGE